MQFDIQKMMKQAQKMQEQMAVIQGELEHTEVIGSAGGGAVTVTCDGKGEMKNIQISPEALEDAETLQDLVMAAYRDAHTKANQMAEQKMGSVMPQGMKMPGMPF